MSWMSKDRRPVDLVDTQKTVAVIREQAGLRDSVPSDSVMTADRLQELRRRVKSQALAICGRQAAARAGRARAGRRLRRHGGSVALARGPRPRRASRRDDSARPPAHARVGDCQERPAPAECAVRGCFAATPSALTRTEPRTRPRRSASRDRLRAQTASRDRQADHHAPHCCPAGVVPVRIAQAAGQIDVYYRRFGHRRAVGLRRPGWLEMLTALLRPLPRLPGRCWTLRPQSGRRWETGARRIRQEAGWGAVRGVVRTAPEGYTTLFRCVGLVERASTAKATNASRQHPPVVARGLLCRSSRAGDRSWRSGSGAGGWGNTCCGGGRCTEQSRCRRTSGTAL